MSCLLLLPLCKGRTDAHAPPGRTTANGSRPRAGTGTAAVGCAHRDQGVAGSMLRMALIRQPAAALTITKVVHMRRAGAPDVAALSAAEASRLGLPRLVVVVDEFRVLAEELPDFVAGLVRLAVVGRSLGIHLVLATQRPSGVVSPEIRANTNLRIALRVQRMWEAGFVDEVRRLADRGLLTAVETVERNTDEALRRGVFGAPSYLVGDEVFWGQDRLPLLETHLAALADA